MSLDYVNENINLYIKRLESKITEIKHQQKRINEAKTLEDQLIHIKFLIHDIAVNMPTARLDILASEMANLSKQNKE